MQFYCFYICSFLLVFFFFFSSRRRHTRLTCDWSSDVCSSDLPGAAAVFDHHRLAEVVLQCRGEAARGDVGAPARRRGHDQPDRPRRILRQRWPTEEMSEKHRKRYSEHSCQHVSSLEFQSSLSDMAIPGGPMQTKILRL